MSDLYLFKTTLRDLVRIKRVLLALLLVAVPAIIAGFWKYRVHAHAMPVKPDVIYSTLSAGLVFGFILVLLSVVFGAGIVSQEMEQKTIVYLLTRPVPRWRILLAKFLAVLVVVIATVWIASLTLAFVSFGSSALHVPAVRRDLMVAPVGAVAYGSLFLLAATVLARPLLWGLLFTFGWESWAPNLPGSFKKGSLMAYLRVLAPHPTPEADSMDLTSLMNALSPTTISRTLSWEVLSIVTVVCLVGALAVFSLKEYVPRDDAE
ncbi:MAG TPA: ABC transporter permease [Armatimonadota bacterium]|jgi:ABC-2 type transport system permease protein